jgi:hypothetical protein
MHGKWELFMVNNMACGECAVRIVAKTFKLYCFYLKTHIMFIRSTVIGVFVRIER